MAELEQILLEYGLKEKQARVYLACLQLGSGSILRIAEQAILARSTAELELKALQQKGFVYAYKKKQTRYYSAEDPHKIIMLLREKTGIIERALPKFMALYGSTKSKPSVRFYEGQVQMKLILKEILNEAQELLCFSSAEDMFEVIKNFPEFVQDRIKKKIPVKVILRDSPKAQERKILGPNELREVRLIPSKYEYHGLIYIYNDKIIMFSFKNDFITLVTQSKELVEVQSSLFLALWDSISKV